MAEPILSSMQRPDAPSCSPEPGATSGFSLIEVLVALVIAGLVMAAVAGVFSDGLLAHRAGDEVATALSLAEEKLASAGAVQPLRPGGSSGEFAGRFRWQLTIAPYEDGAGDTAAIGRPGAPLQLYRIEAAIGWREGLRQRRLSLATLRLGSAPP